MAELTLDGIGHAYDTRGGESSFSIESLSITWRDGTANALLGPSGCGKTTLLNILSGLLRPNAGYVRIDGVDVTDAPPKQRHVAQVFQFPVVYETMTVFDNLAFPLRNAGYSTSRIQPRVSEIAGLLGLDDVLHQRARRLTPAVKQKISLGRGIVREDTAAVLLDEPLTIIDPQVKWELRRSLREVQRELGMTMIYVTHDQHEALTFAENVSVMSQGAIVQTGTPQELHEDPASPFVGFFIGSPGMNIIPVSSGSSGRSMGTGELELPSALRSLFDSNRNLKSIGIRPEHLEVRDESFPDAFRCTARVIEDIGAYKVLSVEGDGLELKARVREDLRCRENDTLWLRVPPEYTRPFE